MVIPADIVRSSRGDGFPDVVAEQQVEFDASHARYVAEREIPEERAGPGRGPVPVRLLKRMLTAVSNVVIYCDN